MIPVPSRADLEQAAAAVGCRLSVLFIERGEVVFPKPGVVLVVNNSTDSDWWQSLACHASAICLIKGRLPWKSDLQGQTALYYGPEPGRFTEVFSRFGAIIGPCCEVPTLRHLPDGTGGDDRDHQSQDKGRPGT